MLIKQVNKSGWSLDNSTEAKIIFADVTGKRVGQCCLDDWAW